jgi:hypothetical protein
MSSSVLSRLALDDVVDGSSPDLTPQNRGKTRASKKPRANHSFNSERSPFPFGVNESLRVRCVDPRGSTNRER